MAIIENTKESSKNSQTYAAARTPRVEVVVFAFKLVELFKYCSLLLVFTVTWSQIEAKLSPY